MYLEHFGLNEFPFSLAPDPRFLFLSGQHREALAHLLYGVMSEGGFVQITGEVGTGKTTVCRCFLERLPEGTEAAVILNPRLSAEELLAAVCDEFRIPPAPGAATVKNSLDRLNAFLLDVHAGGGRAVLVVDEAQNLDPAALELVRLLTNLETSRHKLLQIVLMGQPELRAALARPELRQLAQRVTARFHLGPLSREETGAYLRHRLAVAGCHDVLFPADVVWLMQRLSGGIPRMVNILADRALLGAYTQGMGRVSPPTLRQAALEVSGKARAPRSAPRTAAAAAAVAAFAALVTMAGLAILKRPVSVPPSAPAPATSAPQPQAVAPAPEGTPAAVAADPVERPAVAAAPAAPAPEPAPAPPAPRKEAAPTPPPSPSPTTVAVRPPQVQPADPPPVLPPVPVPAPPPEASAPPGGMPAGTPDPDGGAAVAPGPARDAPEAPPALAALLLVPGAREEGAAMRRLFEILGAAWSAEGGQDACELARLSGLACLRGRGTWENVLRHGHPGVVGLRDGGGPAWILLEGQQGGQVTLAAGEARTVVAAERLARYPVEEYLLAWKRPSQAPAGSETGSVLHP